MNDIIIVLFFSALKDTRETLSEASAVLDELDTLSHRLKDELVKLGMFYKEAQRFCLGRKNIEDDDDICKMFVDDKDVFSETNPIEVTQGKFDFVLFPIKYQ